MFRKLNVTFHLKSGAALNVLCEDIKVTKNSNELVGWMMEKLYHPGQAFYIRIDDVSAITYKRVWHFGLSKDYR